ncbi:uncharacterized protein MYCGRDRAFT_107596 [Zymoseptoria tritici IPO323]|uniref:A-kinase anchor protein 7-like phosphoesterase domain-containing protein n=1 Tax=Zymoseptoria tritici (strain CBS 115943 / IPO323) TaxID=336722 RepID=F9WYD4_ZYMTI|nr:uncharacterized protein MYCGRDRAFT_107596 [Zymoseptoria tritici IPO323]EGP91603.1 hypothetical protein MYCGRDRAFT_107596 [Zymoseptoria tritici IPO323]
MSSGSSANRSNKKSSPGGKRPPLTHFLCVPLVTPASESQLQTSLKTFRGEVSPSSPSENITAARGAHASPQTPAAIPTIPHAAIRPVGTLHCTLGVMSLDQNQLAAAIELLQSCEVTKLFEDSATTGGLDSSPLTIELKGLVSMHAPQSTSILYAEPVDSSQRLYPFCVALQALFRSKGFLIPNDRSLKLHATIINTIYAKGNRKSTRQKLDSTVPGPAAEKLEDRSRGHGPNAKAPIKLDARPLIEKYEDFLWAKNIVLDRIAICEMGAKKVHDAQGNVVEEKYTEVAHVELPT